MKRALMAVGLLASLLVAVPPAHSAIPQRTSPPGQLYVVTVNAAQNKVIGTQRFAMMLELARAVLKRPAAFDGGSDSIGAAPDVIIVQEMRESNLDIFEKLLRQRSDFRYDIVGSAAPHGQFIINSDTVALQGDSRVWKDPCYEAGETERTRSYQWAQFTDLDTNAPFAVASVHFDKAYVANTGESNCLERNVTELRRQLDRVTAPTIIGGDFNKRAMESPSECDPNEESAPLSWWLALTAPDRGTVYTDTVRDFHRATGESMADEWTHEPKAATVACDESTRFRRNRIDYLFSAGMETATVHADHPGWAGVEPGTRHPTNPRYSDHRFVAGRFKIAGPARPAPPTVVQAASGVLRLSWTAPETPVSGWLLYRATGTRPYSLLAQLPPETLAYDDFSTEHGQLYRYALAAVDQSGAQSVESVAAVGVADARGPQITSRTPGRNGIDIERGTDIVARYDEPVDPGSVFDGTMNLYRDGRRVCGSTFRVRARALSFDPCSRLRADTEYKVVVYAVSDRLGNRGQREAWTFTTR